MLSLKMLTSCFNGGNIATLTLSLWPKLGGDKKKGGAKNELRQGRHLVSLVKGKCVGVQRKTCKYIPIFGNLDSWVSNKFGARVEKSNLVQIEPLFN